METSLKTNFTLSALWQFILLNIIFRDIHQMTMKSHLEMLLTGTYYGTVITDEIMLLGGFLVEIPIAMFLCSLLLKRELNRTLNMITSVLMVGVLLAELPSDMDDVFFKIIEFVAVGFIFWISLKWKATNKLSTVKA